MGIKPAWATVSHRASTAARSDATHLVLDEVALQVLQAAAANATQHDLLLVFGVNAQNEVRRLLHDSRTLTAAEDGGESMMMMRPKKANPSE